VLGIELREIEGWACCGASSAHSSNELLAISLPARDLTTASKADLPVVAVCAMCFSRLKISAHELQDAETRRVVSEVVGEEVQASVPVVHLLEVMDARLETIPVKKPLEGLKVACYYGCLLVRPRKLVGIDDAENPQIMDRLMGKLGAEPVAWGFKTECCGASMPLARPDMVERLCHRILSQAKRAGADCLVVACPECHANLDMHQKDIQASYGGEVGLPVLYFTQLLGLTLGYSAYELHLDKHLVNAMPLLRDKGLV
jgi:heterodisulfide reductase subunit B